MRFLKKKTVWSNGELGLVKTAMVSMGIVTGLYFYKYMEDFTSLFLIIFIVSGILTFFIWMDKMRSR